jgi:integrase
MPEIKITKREIDKLNHPQTGQVFYRDKSLKGFGVYVGKTSKTYFVEKWVGGKAIRTTIGKHGPLNPVKARKKAEELLGKMSVGENPNLEKKNQVFNKVTLKETFEDFFKTRKNLTERTIHDYRRFMNGALKSWQTKRITEISKSMVAEKHTRLGEEIGHAQANQSMRVLRAVFSFAMGKYENGKGQQLILVNPVRVLSETKAWFKVKRRETIIKEKDLASWYQAVSGLKNNKKNSIAESVRDYLLLLLFTGLRREEAAKLKWGDVNFEEKTLTISDTKNHRPLVLPLTKFLFNLLKKRSNAIEGDYVFPGKGVKGHIVEPGKQIKKVIEESGVQFTIHDLRRTFSTIAESLDIHPYSLKRLVNHKSGMGGDVTQGYVIHEIERLRKLMQKITDRIFKLVKEKSAGGVIQFPYKKSS